MTSCYGNIFLITHILLQMTSNVELWCLLRCQQEKAVEQIIDQCLIRYPVMLIWCHCYMMPSSKGNIFGVTGPLWGNSPVTGEFPTQRPVTRSFGDFFDLRLKQRLSKHSWGWWFETQSRPLWRHCNVCFYSVCSCLWSFMHHHLRGRIPWSH